MNREKFWKCFFRTPAYLAGLSCWSGNLRNIWFCAVFVCFCLSDMALFESVEMKIARIGTNDSFWLNMRFLQTVVVPPCHHIKINIDKIYINIVKTLIGDNFGDKKVDWWQIWLWLAVAAFLWSRSLGPLSSWRWSPSLDMMVIIMWWWWWWWQYIW